MPDMNAELEMIKKVQQQNELKSQLKAQAKTDINSLNQILQKRPNYQHRQKLLLRHI
ncbi:hypothetical protein ACEQPO_03865 [Bacillus sp. SL00103]